jgi:hypothetical protein
MFCLLAGKTGRVGGHLSEELLAGEEGWPRYDRKG